MSDYKKKIITITAILKSILILCGFIEIIYAFYLLQIVIKLRSQLFFILKYFSHLKGIVNYQHLVIRRSLLIRIFYP